MCDQETKICGKCNLEKPKECFSRGVIKKDGLYLWCKECAKKYRREYYILNRDRILFCQHEKYLKEREKVLARARRYSDNNKNVMILKQAKRRAKEKGTEFNITIDDIIIPEYCPVLGIKIVTNNHNIDKSRKTIDHYTSPSLDRIDNNKGYIKGNVMVISHRANVLKSNGTLDEFLKIIEYIKKYMPIHE